MGNLIWKSSSIPASLGEASCSTILKQEDNLNKTKVIGMNSFMFENRIKPTADLWTTLKMVFHRHALLVVVTLFYPSIQVFEVIFVARHNLSTVSFSFSINGLDRSKTYVS